MGWRLKPSDALIFNFFLQTRFQRWLGCASTSSLLGSVCLQLVTGWAHTLGRGKVFFTGNVTSWLALLCQRLHFLFYSRVFGVGGAAGWSKWKKVIKQAADRLSLLLLRIMATERVFCFVFLCTLFGLNAKKCAQKTLIRAYVQVSPLLWYEDTAVVRKLISNFYHENEVTGLRLSCMLTV